MMIILGSFFFKNTFGIRYSDVFNCVIILITDKYHWREYFLPLFNISLQLMLIDVSYKKCYHIKPFSNKIVV